MMHSEVFEAALTGVSLPALSLPSLRLLVPPVQLVAASMCQALRHREVTGYWKVAEFVSLVTEAVPELLVHKHSTQLHLGLRARYILELCRSEQLADPEFISSYLDKVKPMTPKPAEENAVEMDVMETHFLELVQTLLKDSEEREHFFKEVFPVEYGPLYDSDLQTLFYEFLSRLTHFLPTPDFDQTVSWLGSATSVLEECVPLVSAPTDLKNLLQHHKHLGHLEQHVPPSSMGECIVSTLSTVHPGRVSTLSTVHPGRVSTLSTVHPGRVSTLSTVHPGRVATHQSGHDHQTDPSHCLNDHNHPVSFVDDDNVAVEIIAVTDYAEVELGTTSAAEDAEEEEVVLIDGSCFAGTVIETSVTEDFMDMLPAGRAEKTEGAEEEEEEEEEASEAGEEDSGPAAVLVRGEEAADVDDQVSLSRHKSTTGPHVCPQCHKTFKLASSLLAHGVVHSGQRPYRCDRCHQCFSFRQSLDRHKHTHDNNNNKRRGRRTYDCAVCGEAFRSLSARSEHRRTHERDNDAAARVCCPRCDGRFGSESALARHLKSDAACRHRHQAGSESSALVESRETTEKATQGDEVVAVAALHESDSPAAPRVDCGRVCDRDPKVEEDSRNSPCPSSQPGGDGDAGESVVKVRTSGRTRKPTMKVQAIDLQKRVEKNSAAKKRRSGSVLERPPVLKLEPFNSTEHSYGSPMVSAKDADEGPVGDGSSPAFSCPSCSFCHVDEAGVRQHIDDVHPAGEEQGGGTDSKPAAPPLLLLPPADLLQEVGGAEEGRFSCPDCPKRFKFRSLLKAHQRLHTGEQPYLCSQCGRRFSFKQSLERHRQTHRDGRQYQCPVCGQALASLAQQREHRSSHMENGDYVCTRCGRAFTWKSALVRHLKTHRDEEDAGKEEEEKEEEGKEEEEQEKEEEGEQEKEKVTQQRSHKCSHCEASFGSAGHLSRHLQTHREERTYACNCGKSFAYQAALRAHQRIHQEERPHRCTQCGKGFLYKGGLLSHMKIHSEEMPFMCSFCGKSFKRERNMKKHERCHTRENVFACSQCDKSFVYKATLTRHELTHSGERPFLCSDCGKGFFSHAELLKHERFHTGHKPFQCPHCGKRFTQSCYLTIHLRYHTGARPYPCTHCDKSFLSANRLKRHQRTHTGEKPYLCVECGKGFKQSYHLKMHQRTHALK